MEQLHRGNYIRIRQICQKLYIVLQSSFCVILISSLLIGVLPSKIALAAGSIGGIVFNDLNADGLFDTTREPGVTGVTVTAYDVTGSKQGSTVTGADGRYHLTTTGTGPYRVEFTTLPAGFQPGPAGAQSGTTVQFVNGDSATDLDLGLSNPAEYCQNNPNMAVSCFVAGDPLQNAPANLAATREGAALVAFPYNASGDTPQNTVLANASAIGAATWGLAYQRSSKTLFVAAVQRRHSGYGALGTGGIYAVNLATATPTIANFIDLNTLKGINTGANPHVGLPGCRQENPDCNSIDAPSFDAVGKVSLGDIEFSADEETLWAVNLNQRTLLAIQVGLPPHTPTAADVQSYAMLGHGAPTCTNGEFRPWGLKVHNGLVYVGGVCSAEKNGTAADLAAYILTFNPSQPAAGFSTLLTFPLNYAKGCAWHQGQADAYGCQWNPWLAQWPSVFVGQGGDNFAWPQPILSDIEFDVDGSLILGFADRWFLQGGEPQPPANATDPVSHVVHVINAGDILRVCYVNGAFALPGSANCPNQSNNKQGPGGGEFYAEDNAPTGYTKTGENSHGGLALLPGSGEVATTAIEPFDSNDDAGIIWHNNRTGKRNRAYTVAQANYQAGKALGLGDIEILCDAAPLEIGNRVWQDSNANGVQDPGEPGIAGVTVELYRNSIKVGSTSTAADGQYYFNNRNVNLNGATGIVPGTGIAGGASEYTVQIPAISGAHQQTALVGYQLTETHDAVASPSGSALNDSDGQVNGEAASYTIPALDLRSAGNNNHTYDFGFIPLVNLGDLVWHDANNNGIRDAGEAGLDGVTLHLFHAGDNPLTATPVATTITSNGGLYHFTNLLPGNYFVYLPTPPAAYPHSSDVTDTQDDGLDNDDNGSQTKLSNNAPGPVTSPVVNLAAGAEPDTAVDGNDRNGDQTLDFGFYAPVQVGDFVWLDQNQNGRQDVGPGSAEVGVPNVQVTLYTSAGVVVTADADGNPVTPQTTDANGNYHFTNLPPGAYYVVFNAATLPAGMVVTAQNATGVARDLDSDGDQTTGQTAATNFLSSGSQDLTLDLGIYQPSVAGVVRVGDFVWDDLNANGRQDAGEPGIAGVKATLFRSNGEPTGLVTTTDADGFYLFDNLPTDSYYVRFDLTSLPAGYVVTTQDAGTNDAIDSDADSKTGQTAPTGLLPAGTEDRTLDMGVFKPASLGDYVWLDQNHNGLQDAGETPVANVIVTLFNAQNQLVATTTTNSQGLYYFTALQPGSYYVSFALPTGYTYTKADQGGDEAKDSDADTRTGDTPLTTLVSGENDLTWDAGMVPTLNAALGGHTWNDGLATQADGIRVADESLLNGVTAILLDATGKEISHTLTSADGFYLFDNLQPGQYMVSFHLPTGFIGFTMSHQGDNNSDANPVTGQTVMITLVAGQRDLTWDAGFILQVPTSIHQENEPGVRRLFLPFITR